MRNDRVISQHSDKSNMAGPMFSFLLPLCSVADAFIDWNILMVVFLGRIHIGPSQLLVLYDLCPLRPMKSLFPSSANVMCTRAVKEGGPGHPSGTWALARSPTGPPLTCTFGPTCGLILGSCGPVWIIRGRG